MLSRAHASYFFFAFFSAASFFTYFRNSGDARVLPAGGAPISKTPLSQLGFGDRAIVEGQGDFSFAWWP